MFIKRLRGVVLSALYILSILASVCTFSAHAAAFSGGSGTSLDPYIITNCQELQDIRNNLAASYSLNNDIDCAALSASPGITPIGDNTTAFTGRFIGNGHTIFNVSINDSLHDFIGLFGETNSNAVVSDFKMYNISINGRIYVGGAVGLAMGGTLVNKIVIYGSSVTGIANVGGIVGRIINSGIQDSTIVTSSVQGNLAVGTVNDVGGAIGNAAQSTIYKVYANTTVTGNASGASISSSYIGGLAGSIDNTDVQDSYSAGSIVARNDVGGFAGISNDSTINNIYSSTSVTGDLYVGGLFGRFYGGNLDHSFAAGAVTGTTNVAAVIGGNSVITGGTVNDVSFDTYTTTQSNCVADDNLSFVCAVKNSGNATPDYYKNSSTNAPFNSWDFGNIWRKNATTYPSLQIPPERLDNVHVNPSATSLKVSWEVSDDGGSPVTSYDFEYNKQGGEKQVVYGLSGAILTYTLQDLSPSTTYEVNVRANNARGYGQWTGFVTSTLAPVVETPTANVATQKKATTKASSSLFSEVTETSNTTSIPNTAETKSATEDILNTPAVGSTKSRNAVLYWVGTPIIILAALYVFYLRQKAN